MEDDRIIYIYTLSPTPLLPQSLSLSHSKFPSSLGPGTAGLVRIRRVDDAQGLNPLPRNYDDAWGSEALELDDVISVARLVGSCPRSLLLSLLLYGSFFAPLSSSLWLVHCSSLFSSFSFLVIFSSYRLYLFYLSLLSSLVLSSSHANLIPPPKSVLSHLTLSLYVDNNNNSGV